MDAREFHAAPDTDKRAIGRLLRFALIASVGFAVVLLVLLAGASANTSIFERHYPALLVTTAVMALALLVLVAELIRRLIQRYRRGLFGTRLMARLALSFTVMTVIPVSLIYLVSVHFIGRSVESWFAVPVERALDSGMSLGRATLDAQLSDLLYKARAVSVSLGDTPPSGWSAQLNRLREQLDLQDALVVSGGRNLIVAVGGRLSALVPDLPTPAALRQARLTRLYSTFETREVAGQSFRGLLMRVIVPVNAEGLRFEEGAYLQLIQEVPALLAEHTDALEQGRRDFQQLALSRESLSRIFNVTLTLIFILTVFSAVAAAFLLSGWLTGPLSMLAAGTRAVAEGDYRPVKAYSGRDELGVLTQSFNMMTRQLEDARTLVERNQREIEQAHARLVSVLANLTAGVMVLDAHWRITLANPGAEQILGQPLDQSLGMPISAIAPLAPFSDEIRQAFLELQASGPGSWQRQFVLPSRDTPPSAEPASAASAGKTLLARGSMLPGEGFVIVFDDLTEVISAQRTMAWAEVARRLAHEIKNPLTPIQLSAERLKLRLHDKLSGSDADLLNRSSQTIVDQVAALKHLVDEFREYARLPAARLAPLDLNQLIDEIAPLFSASGRLHTRLAPDCPLVMADAAQLRQVILNLIGNAIEATERVPTPRVELLTGVVRLADGESAVRLLVRDNGPGFTPSMLARAFEPYVTSKPRGTGLGLAIVRKIVDEHGARIDLGNRTDESGTILGAQIALLFTKIAKSGENPRLSAATTA
jgi:nitrogen fixation/metabolism regulation signal transduction histidine kinase